MVIRLRRIINKIVRIIIVNKRKRRERGKEKEQSKDLPHNETNSHSKRITSPAQWQNVIHKYISVSATVNSDTFTGRPIAHNSG